MTDTSLPPADPSAPVARSMRPPRLLAGFGVLMGWALRRTFFGKRFFLAIAIALGLGFWIGTTSRPSGSLVTDGARYYKLWLLLDGPLITFLLPFATLVFVAQGFSREVSQRTLVFHLVRPIRRSTLYLARYTAGVIPAVIVCILGLSAMALGSGLDVPTSVYVAIASASVVGVLSLGALYYLFSAIFRHGLITGLVYTFLFEVLLSQAKGAVVKLSASYHLRSLIRGLINDDFAERSEQVKNVVSPQTGLTSPEDAMSDLMAAAGGIVYETPTTAIITLLVTTVVLLTIGVYVIRRRDFALKD